MDYDDAVVLVVGSDTECKTRFADALARGRGALKLEVTKANVRLFSRDSCPEAVIVDTVPFHSSYFADEDMKRIARVWISQNSLKRLFGKLVYLVCVVNSSNPKDHIDEDSEFPWVEKVSWLHILAFIFKEYNQTRIILASSEDSHDCEVRKFRMRDALYQAGFDPSNVTFASLRGGDLVSGTMSFGMDSRRSMVPFLIREVASNARDIHKFGPWGPERVFLFGRSGSGKSTLAQMLTTGKLDPCCKDFAIGSGIRGKTKTVTHGEGRGWYVVDTPGFGEPQDELSSTSTAEAEKKIKRYVQLIEGTYSHFLYVVEKGRIDELEVTLWNFFVLLFGENIRYNFTVVISTADQRWVDENIDHLKKYFEGCQSFIGAQFPPKKMDDEEWEADLQETRLESLKSIEDELASLARSNTFCDFGKYSKMTSRGDLASTSSEISEMKSFPKRVIWSTIKGAVGVYWDLRRLIYMLMRDDKIVLVPLQDL